MSRDGQKATLVVYEAFPKDAGIYTINASNITGETSSTCNVTVKGRLPNETSDSELASDMEPVKPSIQLPLKNESVLEGNRVRLDCVIVGQPEPEVIWYHDDRPVKESADFQLLFQGDRCSLIIQEALPEDAGEYKVVAINSAGEASSKCVLNVTPVESDKSAIPPSTEAAPKFSKLLTDVLVSEGDKVTLECCVTGEPKPEIKWLLNNELIPQNDHFKTSLDNEGNARLEIDTVQPEDKGVYTVKASNKIGDAKCFAQVIVKSQRVQETTKYEEVKSPPIFKESFSDRVINEGASTKFECLAVGKPAPKIKWLFNDFPVTGKDYLVSTSGDRQVLSIPEVKNDNQGRITCVAENEVGKAVCSAQLIVQQTQDLTLPDGSIQAQPGYTMKREVITQMTSSSSSRTLTQGGEPQVEVHSVTTQDEKTLKQINQDEPEVKESHVIKEYHQVGKQPPVIHEKVLSSATNAAVELQKTVAAPEPLQIQRRLRPPKFTTPVIGKIVDQGVDVVLEGIVDGQPTPQVTWTKNGEEIKPTRSIDITFDLHRVRLEIKSVTTNDSGRYSCTAVNDAGTAVSTADLVVRSKQILTLTCYRFVAKILRDLRLNHFLFVFTLETIFPPVFGRRLQAQVLKKGDRVLMEVEITGTPEPSVTWYKDGQPLAEVLKEGIKLRTQGNCHSLLIERGCALSL